jgi:Ni/Co efflux regulator RcnB
VFEHNQEKEMKKLLSLIVAAMFAAVSVSALAASHAGAQEKKDEAPKKTQATKTDSAKKAPADSAKKTPAKADTAKKTQPKTDSAKKTPAKTTTEGAKKDEMKK